MVPASAQRAFAAAAAGAGIRRLGDQHAAEDRDAEEAVHAPCNTAHKGRCETRYTACK